MSAGEAWLKDGGHDWAIEVTPLQPPFREEDAVCFLQLEGMNKRLALSAEEYKKVEALLGGRAKGKTIKLVVGGDTSKIKVRLG